MRILYTGTYNSVLSFLAWNVIISDCMLHNTLPNMEVQLYFHLHKRCIIVQELDLLVHVLFCGAIPPSSVMMCVDWNTVLSYSPCLWYS